MILIDEKKLEMRGDKVTIMSELTTIMENLHRHMGVSKENFNYAVELACSTDEEIKNRAIEAVFQVLIKSLKKDGEKKEENDD